MNLSDQHTLVIDERIVFYHVRRVGRNGSRFTLVYSVFSLPMITIDTNGGRIYYSKTLRYIPIGCTQNLLP